MLPDGGEVRDAAATKRNNTPNAVRWDHMVIGRVDEEQERKLVEEIVESPRWLWNKILESY